MKKVVKVDPINEHELKLTFDTNEVGIFSVRPYLERGIFRQLKDIDYLKKVRVFFDSIAWPNGQDFDPDHLYLECRFFKPNICIST